MPQTTRYPYQDELDFKRMGVKLPLTPQGQRVYDELRKALGRGPIPEGALILVPVLVNLLGEQLINLGPAEMSEAEKPEPAKAASKPEAKKPVPA
jgi:hypothetical protein